MALKERKKGSLINRYRKSKELFGFTRQAQVGYWYVVDSSARQGMPRAVLRIRDVYPGSRIRIFSISDPGSASKNKKKGF